MSGNSTSFNSATMVGCRVAGPADYTPAYIRATDGKQMRQMATFNVYQNLKNGKSKFRITAFGKMADVIAKSCPAGKELTLECEFHSFAGRVPVPGTGANGVPLQFVTGQDGQPITIEKTGFTIQKIHFGADSAKQIAYEIQNGMRPAGWAVAGSPDAVAWDQEKARRNNLVFRPGKTGFGYARVIQPNGQIIDPATLAYNNGNANTYQAPTVNVGTAQTNTPVGNGTPGFGGVATPQVQVNGQNMGYPVGNGQPTPAQYQQTAPVAGGSSFAM